MKNIIYGLRCPKTDEYRYIGKSTSGLMRAKSHLTFSHNEAVNIWVNDLRNEGFLPCVDVLEECHIDELQIKEKYWINYYSSVGCKLLNKIPYKGATIEKLQNEIDNQTKQLESKLEQLKKELELLKNLGQFIKNRRKVLKISQKDLSEYSQTSLRAIIMIENNEGNPTYKTIKNILNVLGYEFIPVLR